MTKTPGTRINGRPAPIDSITPISGSDAVSTPVANVVEGAETVRGQVYCAESSSAILLLALLTLSQEKLQETQAYRIKSERILNLVTLLCDLDQERTTNAAHRAAAAGEADLQIELEKGAMVVQLEEVKGLSFKIDTPMATMRISGANRVEVSHNPNTGKSTFEVIEGSSDVAPKSPSAPSFFLPPGTRVEISASGVTRIRTGSLFSDSFE